MAMRCLEKHQKPTEAEPDWPGKLVDGLAGEKVRWTESLGKFDTQSLAGKDIFLLKDVQGYLMLFDVICNFPENSIHFGNV